MTNKKRTRITSTTISIGKPFEAAIKMMTKANDIDSGTEGYLSEIVRTALFNQFELELAKNKTLAHDPNAPICKKAMIDLINELNDIHKTRKSKYDYGEINVDTNEKS